MTEEEAMPVTVARVKEIAREVDNLLSTIRGTVELLAASEFQEDIYHPSLRAVGTMTCRTEGFSGTSFENKEGMR